MSKFLLSSIILVALTACNGQDIPPAQNRSEAAIITDSSGLTLEQRIKNLEAPDRNDSNFIGKQMARLKAVNVNGDTINQKALSRIVFYNFWFTGCAPCIAEMPYFNTLAAEYADEVDFVAITFENLGDLSEFLKQHPFNFQLYSMDRNEINKSKLVGGYPTTIVAVEGEIVSWKSGGIPSSHPSFKEEMEKQNDNYRELFEKNLWR